MALGSEAGLVPGENSCCHPLAEIEVVLPHGIEP